MAEYEKQDDLRALVPLAQASSSRIALAGQIANEKAREGVLERYRERKTEQTLRRQRADIALFERYLTEAQAALQNMADDLAQWGHITFGLVEGFQRWQLQQGYSIGSVNVRTDTIRMYCTLAMQAGFLDPSERALIYTIRKLNPKEGRNIDEKRKKRGIKTRKDHTKKDRPVVVDPLLCRRLKDHLRVSDTDLARRDLLLICLLADHGLRCGEVASLKASSICLARGTLTFYRHKVNKTQTHYLTDDTTMAARLYFERFHPTDHLFEGDPRTEKVLPDGRVRPGKAREDGLDDTSINARVRVLGRLIGIKNLSPHDLRHSWATEHARQGVNVKALQQAGGWSSPYMPLHYVQDNEIANEELLNRNAGMRRDRET
jgi:integrase